MYQQDNKIINSGTPILLERTTGKLKGKAESQIVGVMPSKYVIVDMPFVSNTPFLTSWDSNCIVRFITGGSLIGFRSKILSLISTPYPMVVLDYPEQIERIKVRKHPRISCSWLASLSFEREAKPPASESKPDKPPLSVLDPAGGEVEVIETGIHPSSPPPTPNADPRMHGILVDISVGGCQIQVPVLQQGKLPASFERIARRITPPEESAYSAAVIQSQYVSGKTVELALEIPLPVAKAFSAIPATVRRCSFSGSTAVVGLEFVSLAENVAKAIETAIEFQTTFFTPPQDAVAV